MLSGPAITEFDPSAPASSAPACCPYFHQAVELIGRRWTGACSSAAWLPIGRWARWP